MKKKIKTNKNDFTLDNLPSNRKEVFFDVIKLRWKTLFLIGFYLLISFIPFIASLIIKDNLLINAYSSSESNEEYAQYYCYLYLIYDGVATILLIIPSFSICGSLRIIRQMVWGEEVFFKEDYSKGIKNSIKTVLISLLIFGLILLLGRFMVLFSKDEKYFYIILGVATVVIFPLILYQIMQSTIYSNKFSQSFYNSTLFYFKTAPFIILLALFGFSMYLFKFIEIPLLKYFLIAFYIFFIIPLYLLILTLYSHHVFDKYININFYPDLVDKGMYKNK